MNTISIAIAEDHVRAMQSILKKLSVLDGIVVSCTARNGQELIQKLACDHPDVVLMDIEMPVMDGILATKKIKELYPQIHVLVLTTFDDEERIFNAILAGASGYLLKEESSDRIYQAIRDVLDGGAAMSAGIALKTLKHIKNAGLTLDSLVPDRQNLSSAYAKSVLSKREVDILNALKDGLTYKQIGAQLFISEGTVRKHIENIYRKLHVNNKLSAVNIARKNRWI